MKSIVDFLTSEIPQTESQETVEKIEDVEIAEIPKDETNEAVSGDVCAIYIDTTLQRPVETLYGFDNVYYRLSCRRNRETHDSPEKIQFIGANWGIIQTAMRYFEQGNPAAEDKIDKFSKVFGVDFRSNEWKKIFNLNSGESYQNKDYLWFCVR